MTRKQTATSEIKALFIAHKEYKAFKWQCTGRHRYQINLLFPAVPLSCPNGHFIKVLREITMKQFLKSEIIKIKEKYAAKQEYQLGA